MFKAYNKSVPLIIVCVCVCVCIAETARVRERKVILMLVLGRHECVRGKFYINIIKLVFSVNTDVKLQISSCHLLIRPAFKKYICTDYDYNERVFVFYMFYFAKY